VHDFRGFPVPVTRRITFLASPLSIRWSFAEQGQLLHSIFISEKKKTSRREYRERRKQRAAHKSTRLDLAMRFVIRFCFASNVVCLTYIVLNIFHSCLLVVFFHSDQQLLQLNCCIHEVSLPKPASASLSCSLFAFSLSFSHAGQFFIISGSPDPGNILISI
jgi:hypothetical protein